MFYFNSFASATPTSHPVINPRTPSWESFWSLSPSCTLLIVAGRSSVTRGEASPAPSILDSASRNSRRSSSRASRKATRELELNTSHPSRLAVSLPPTPITSSFEEALSSTQRAKRHRSVNYYEKTPQSKGAETPDQKDASFSAQPSGSTSRKSSRSRKSEKADKDAVKAPDSTGDQAVTPSTSTSNPRRKYQTEQSTLHTYLQKKPQDRRKTLTTPAEASDKNSPQSDPKNDSKSPAMGAAVSSGRTTRKSIPAKLNGTESTEKATPRSKLVTRLSTPVSRKDRKSKSVVEAEQVPKSTPHVKPESTPPVNSTSKAAKSEANGTADPVTPAERTPVSTPNTTATRSRRRDRKSARKSTAGRSQLTNESSQADTATNTDAEDHKPVIKDSGKSSSQDSDKGSSESQQANKRPSNTVTLSLGRKSLESFVQKTLESASYGNEIADSVEGTPVRVYDDSYHFDYDTDMYRNNFGLDGQMDTPASPTSFSTTTSTGARMSGRARKPTIRALESLESERRFRRPRAQTPGKADSSAAGKQSDKAPSGQKNDEQPKAAPAETTQAPSATPQPDVDAFARRIFELAAAAVSDDFVPAPEADSWLEELRKEYQGKGDAEIAAVAAVVEGESRQPSDNEPTTEQWTDEDGWMHTGQINEFGEEYVVVGPDFEWYRPNNTYGDTQLPEPPVRLRSLEQSEKDRIFGFPPRIGERNLPRATNFPFMMEDVYHERAKIKAREEARQKGISVDRSMSVSQIEELIGQHSKGSSSQSSETPAPAPASVKSSKPDRPSRKRRRTEPVIPSEAPSTNESTTESTHKPKRRRKNTAGASAAGPTDPEPSSEKPKTLKLKLIFSKRELPATPSASNTTNTSTKSNKRPHAEIEADGDNAASNGPPKSPNTTPSNPTTTPRRLLKLSTPKQGQKETSNAAPTSTPDVPPSADPNSLTRPVGVLVVAPQQH
ncbi:GPI-anchored cell surface glycoprotein [Aspergillus bombycis]|uniref:GPI-anchored cell surface glycoprotein n=1 Tax=Aspergillus bombycis TaxID=109264 RepID=A0A1F7ZWA3_9EURO|nr:GPI-anchored cell surface glycoprotein [Aspergillus bombycis]OGM43539.1 GPI-anchored cell surface glycoprotein [Aspergillus bombycis]